MIVAVSHDRIELREPARFDRLHVESSRTDVGQLLRAAAAGRLVVDPGVEREVDISIPWLRAQASAAGLDDSGWHEGFGRMLEFADSRGWVDASGDYVRAHVA